MLLGFLDGLNKTGVFGPFAAVHSESWTTPSGRCWIIPKTSATLMGVGGALTGVGATLTAFGLRNGSHQQLTAAVGATGKSYDDYAEQIETTIGKQEKFGNTSVQTQTR